MHQLDVVNPAIAIHIQTSDVMHIVHIYRRRRVRVRLGGSRRWSCRRRGIFLFLG